MRALWTKTRIPFTRANALAYGEALFSLPRSVLGPAIESLIEDGIVLADGSAEDSVLLWPGEDRPSLGPKTVDEAQTLDRLQREASLPVPVKTPAWMLAKPREEVAIEKKSVLASGALSLVFGPLGWLYAGPVREALPAVVIFGLASAIVGALLPAALASALTAVAFVASGLVGMAYAYRYNQRGRRTPLLEEGASGSRKES